MFRARRRAIQRLQKAHDERSFDGDFRGWLARSVDIATLQHATLTDATAMIANRCAHNRWSFVT